MQAVELPRYIDEPPMFFLWSLDEAIFLFIGMGVGFISGSVLIWTVVGAVCAKVYRRFKDGKPDGYLLHFVYWHGLAPGIDTRSIPDAFVRQFLP